MAEGNRQEAIKSKEATKSFAEEVAKQEQQLVAFLDSQEQILCVLKLTAWRFRKKLTM
jgi:hypothetical protein